MVARQDGRAEARGRFLRLALRDGDHFLGARLGDLVGVVGAVECGEALEVGGRPAVFALQELVDFALRGGPQGDGGGVVGFGFLDGGAGGADEVL